MRHRLGEPEQILPPNFTSVVLFCCCCFCGYEVLYAI